MDRRNFFEAVGGALAGTALFSSAALKQVQAAVERTAHLSPQNAARDETLWRDVQNAVSVNRRVINLDNGALHPSPRNVTESLVRHTWEIQNAPYYEVREILEPLLSAVRQVLAESFGCVAEEIALVRNATEALDVVLLGVELSQGDEILMSTGDYWASHDAVDARAAREGVAVKKNQQPAGSAEVNGRVD